MNATTLTGPTIAQISASQPTLWEWAARLPTSQPAQLFYALALAGLLGMFTHYGQKWLRGEITGSLLKYLFIDHPRRTFLAFFGVVGAGLTAITSNVFMDGDGHFVGWMNVVWLGLTNGYAADSLANKGTGGVDPEATQPSRPAGGFAIPELLIGLAIVGTITALVLGAKGYVQGVAKDADLGGYNRAVAEVTKRDKTELENAQGQIQTLQRDKDAQADAHAKEQARLAGLHAREVEDEKAKTADVQRRIRSGELVLVDPGRTRTSATERCNPPGDRGSSTPIVTTTTATGSGQAESEGLSPAFAGFLYAEAGLADEVATELEMCWSIARDDRKKLALRP